MKLRNKKTGYVGDFNIECIKERGDYVKVVANDVPYYEIKKECGNLYYYDTLVELNEDWEDYTPPEPLIKDEKVRKAVRAWAEANDIEDGITYLDNGEFRSYLNTTIDFAILVDEHRFDLLKKSEEYTVTELCGEEKE